MRHIIWLMLLTISPLTISQTTVSRGIPSKLISRETPKRVKGEILDIKQAPPCPVAKTGKNISFEENDDGELQIGIKWPNPRFTDNDDGTVTDNLTGLMWMQDINIIGNLYPELTHFDYFKGYGMVSWQEALNFTKNVNEGVYDCDLDKYYQDWRLPNVAELNSLISYVSLWPAISNSEGVSKCEEGNPFFSTTLSVEIQENVQVSCWSSTTSVGEPSRVFVADMSLGQIGITGKRQSSFYKFAWLVRDAQKKSRKGYSQYPSPVRKTGQTTCYDEWGNTIPCEGTGQDGDTLSGMDWPNPRFTINRDNLTVTDNLTGLIWLRNRNPVLEFSPGFSDEDPLEYKRVFLKTAFEYLEAVNNGEVEELSLYNDWRIPNVMELFSLTNHEYQATALPNTKGTGQAREGDPFWNLHRIQIWSSTLGEDFNSSNGETYEIIRDVGFYFGSHGALNVYQTTTINPRIVWLVRGGVIDDE